MFLSFLYKGKTIQLVDILAAMGWRGFPLHRSQPMRTDMHTGRTASPWADTTSPTTKTLRAAFMSRSCTDPHSGHTHSRTLSGIFGRVYPQSEQRFDDGYRLSMPINSRPYQRALYCSYRTNSDQPASLIDFDRQQFFCMLDTDRLSMAITWFSFISRVERLCRKSLRACAIFGFHPHIMLDTCKDSQPNGGCERKGHAWRAALSLPGMNAGVSRAEQ